MYKTEFSKGNISIKETSLTGYGTNNFFGQNTKNTQEFQKKPIRRENTLGLIGGGSVPHKLQNTGVINLG